jgi:signal peptide peptidase SppA
MSIADVLNAPWAITPETHIEMRDIYLAHLRGEKADLAAIEAALGKPLDNKRDGYKVQGGVAVIPIEGIVAKKMNLFTRISGGVSSQALQQDLLDAAADPMVNAIVLLIDSPGGEVDGTQAAANIVRAIRDARKKPIVAVADGMMASAAYWIGSAASKVYITGDTTAVGSIGIVATHTDYSKAEEQRGIKVTEITAGKYKRIASQHEPLSEEGRADIQSQVDHIYSVFVDAVAANRGVDAQTVLDKMADGRVFLGKNSIKAGLVDRVDTLASVVARLQKNAPAKTTVAPKTTAASATVPVTPTAANYMERFHRYMADGLTKFEAMEKAVREQQHAEMLASVAQMHEVREQNKNSNEGETTVTHQTTTATAQSNQDPIAFAKELAAKATDYRRQQEALGNRISYAEAVYAVNRETKSGSGNGAAAVAESDDPIVVAKRLAAKATAYRAEQFALGRRLTIADAVMHVSKQQK